MTLNPIEQSLSRLRLIDTAMVVAEGRPFVSCLLFPDAGRLAKLKMKMGNGSVTDEEVLSSALVRGQVDAALVQLNARLNPWQQVRRYALIAAPPTVGNGELTPTMKLCRHVIEERYSNIIDAMYTTAAKGGVSR